MAQGKILGRFVAKLVCPRCGNQRVSVYKPSKKCRCAECSAVLRVEENLQREDSGQKKTGTDGPALPSYYR